MLTQREEAIVTARDSTRRPASADLSGAIILITGAAGLVGRGLADAAIEAGARVIAVDRTPELLAEAAFPEAVTPIALDLRDVSAIDELAGHPLLAKVDVLVNNAAVTTVRHALVDIPAADVDAILEVNVRACVLLSRTLVRGWISRSAPGVIVNISSPGALRAHDDQAVYDASKGAIDALTRAMAVEWGAHDVRVNAVAPAAVARDRRPAGDVPLGRGAGVDDVAAAVLWLASPSAEMVTGQVLAVDGGLLAQLRTTAPERRVRVMGA